MIGNETGHLLECVELYGKLIDKSENLVYVEMKHCCYFAENDMEKSLFTKRLWWVKHECINIKYMGKFQVGLNLFDQFSYNCVITYGRHNNHRKSVNY